MPGPAVQGLYHMHNERVPTFSYVERPSSQRRSIQRVTLLANLAPRAVNRWARNL